MTDPEWHRTFALVCAAWPNANLPDETSTVWHAMIGHHDAADIHTAIAELGLLKPYCPSASELHGIANGLRQRRATAARDAARQAELDAGDTVTFAEHLEQTGRYPASADAAADRGERGHMSGLIAAYIADLKARPRNPPPPPRPREERAA